MARCDKCKFWEGAQCRRFPPVACRIGAPVDTISTETRPVFEFPYTCQDDWCGEFTRALPADIEARKKPAKPKKGKPNAQRRRK